MDEARPVSHLISDMGGKFQGQLGELMEAHAVTQHVPASRTKEKQWNGMDSKQKMMLMGVVSKQWNAQCIETQQRLRSHRVCNRDLRGKGDSPMIETAR